MHECSYQPHVRDAESQFHKDLHWAKFRFSTFNYNGINYK